MKINMSRLQNRAVDIAVRENLLKDKTQCTIAFVLNARGHVMKEGWNSFVRTHPLQKIASTKMGNEHREYIHAETHAISRVRHPDLVKMQGIVVIRLDRNFKSMLAKPCPSCSRILKDHSIKTVVHT